jgi:hypothetical protein
MIERYQSSIARPFPNVAAPDAAQRAYAQATWEAEGWPGTLEPPRVDRPDIVKIPIPAPRDAEWFRKLAFWQQLGFGISDAELMRDLQAQHGADTWLEIASKGMECRFTVPIALLGLHARIQQLQAELGWFVWGSFDENPGTELLVRHPSDFGDEPWARIVCCRGRFDFIDGLWVHPLISERNPALVHRAVELLDLAPSVSVQSYVPYGHMTDEEIRAMVPALPVTPDVPIEEDSYSDG